MSKFGALLLLFSTVILVTGIASASEPKPLFSNTDTIKIRIEAPFKTISSQMKKSTEPHQAKLILKNPATPETHLITVAARGKSRREKGYCRFPPLRLRFGNKASGNKPAEGSLFKGQKNLKLVTHCQSSKKNQQNVLLEYAAYRLLNLISEQSLRVRLAHIDYVDMSSGELIINRTGFFIEDMDDTAKRTGHKEIDTVAIKTSQLDGPSAVRVALFQYMISNLDYSVRKGPPGGNCCHNTKLMSVDGTANTKVYPVPYDFDQSGLVSTDYAEPPANISVRSVKTRVYRGYCKFNSYIAPQAAVFTNNRMELLSEINSIPGLAEKTKAKASRYLENFFEIMADPDKLEKRTAKNCL